MSPRVQVAMLTFRRNARLAIGAAAVLAEIDSSELDAGLLVVDNDPAAGARSTVEALDHPRLRYLHEPVPGISAARNSALDASSASSALVFIDDDEVPETGWLDALVATWESFESAAVAGAVVADYQGEPHPWVVNGAFFVRPRFPTGTDLDVAATNNLLLDLAAVGDLRFDERFGLTGGEDTLFTRRLRARGHRIVFCDEAVVRDLVPADRSRPGWVLRRQIRSGNTARRVDHELAVGHAARVRSRLGSALGGGARVIGGAAAGAVGTLTRSRFRQARGLRTAARGLGMLSAAVGRTSVEYRRTDT